MTFEEIVDQAIALLQRRGRVTYRMLKLQFKLDDERLEALTEELIEAEHLAIDEDGKVLVWTGGSARALEAAREQARAPLSYTPRHLAEKILTSKSALEGERKQVTVLFADLKSSLELLADRDPEEARQLLDPVLERMMEAVHRYEGTVNQVMGDGIMALFGAPIAHEDHATRACYAALRMQASVQRYAEGVRRTEGLPIQIRVGLNSGEVVVRSIGSDLRMDYTAVGQTTHLAARMEQLALPGSILIAPDTWRLAEDYVQAKALGPMPIKGLTAPLEVYEVVGAGPMRTRVRAGAARGLTRFVGRDAELDQLRQGLERAGSGHGQVAALVGEPGVGKSRLVYEFIHSHRTHGWLILESSSVSYGKATPYLPIVDLLKAYFQIDERDDGRKTQEKVAGKLFTLDAALGPTLPAFLTLLDVPVADPFWQALDPPQRRQRTLEAMKRLLLRESQVQPLLLVFEDLHWIDAETQAMLDSLIDSLPTARVFLLVNYRPEYQHSWGSKTYYRQLRLDPLPPESAEALLQALLGTDAGHETLKSLLLERTQGNPFFLEESVRTLVETHVLVGERGAYQLVNTRPSIQVPATVQAVLAARIDRLPPADKRLLQTAAVIGTEVPFALLHAIAEVPEEALRTGLTRIQAAEFLYETRLFPELEYTFAHALTHEVTYGSLLQERRRVLHARIVEAIEALAPDGLPEQVERLAQHAFRGEVWEKAVAYLRQAGAKAFARSANRDAVTCYEQALVALQHLPDTPDTRAQAIDLRFDLRNALLPLGEHERIFEHLSAAETQAQALDDQRRLGRAYAYLTTYFFVMSDHDRAIASGQRALALTANVDDPPLLAEINFRLGQVYHALGNYERAMGYLRRNLESATEPSSGARFNIPVHFSRIWWIWCLVEWGAFAEGFAHAEDALRVAEATDHHFSMVAASHAIGLLHLRKGEVRKAIPVLERGLLLAQASHIRLFFPTVASAFGAALALSGQVAEGLPLLEQAVEQAVATRTMFGYALLVAALSAAYVQAGRLQDAVPLAHRALAFAHDHREQGYQAWALRLLGEIAAHREPPEVEPAEAHYRQALALAEELSMRPLQAHCHLGLGALYVNLQGCWTTLPEGDHIQRHPGQQGGEARGFVLLQELPQALASECHQDGLGIATRQLRQHWSIVRLAWGDDCASELDATLLLQKPTRPVVDFLLGGALSNDEVPTSAVVVHQPLPHGVGVHRQVGLDMEGQPVAFLAA